MLIADAQVHAWSHGESTGHHRRTPITGEVLSAEMAQAGVDRVVLVPPLWDTSGNGYSLALARSDPQRFAVMGLLDPHLPDLPGRVRGWTREPGMVGMRFLFNTPERLAPVREGRFDAVWPIAEEAGLVVAFLAPGHLDLVDQIATRHPALRIIVDHLGVPRAATGPMAFNHLPQLLAMGKHPNVHVKAVGVGDYALDPYPFRSLSEPLRRVFDAFGAERVMWGSDLSRLHHPYRQCVSHFVEELPWLSGDALRQVMGLNLCRLLDWDTTPPKA